MAEDQATVRMTYSIQGARGDGREWPACNELFTLGRGEAEDLVNGGLAEWPEDEESEKEEEQPREDDDSGEEDDFEDDGNDEDFDNDEGAVTVRRRPAQNESRVKWVNYAISRGMSPEEAHKTTKNNLVKMYKDQ